MNIQRSTIDDAAEILALQKLTYVSGGEDFPNCCSW